MQSFPINNRRPILRNTMKSFLSWILYRNVICRVNIVGSLYQSWDRVHLIPYQDALRRINVVRRDLRTGPIVFTEVRGNSNFNLEYDWNPEELRSDRFNGSQRPHARKPYVKINICNCVRVDVRDSINNNIIDRYLYNGHFTVLTVYYALTVWLILPLKFIKQSLRSKAHLMGLYS